MANLIPPQGKSVVTREYWIRVSAVWMFLLAAACVVVALLMVPTYVLIESQYAAVMNTMQGQHTKEDAFEQATERITTANTLARHLVGGNETASFVTLVDRIEALAGPDVVVQQYRFMQDTAEVSPITIGGQAANRTVLAAFRDALDADTRFASVALPLANLAGDEDITFTMQVTLAVEDVE